MTLSDFPAPDDQQPAPESRGNAEPDYACAPKRIAKSQPTKPIRRVSMFKRNDRSVLTGGVTAVPYTKQRPTFVPAKSSTGTEGRRQLRWLPNQHGAWPMLLLPFWSGVFLSQFVWQDLILFCCWVTGFFLFDAFTTWMRSRFKDRYFLPVKVWGSLTLLFGTATVILLPALLEWGIFFAPLLTALTYLSWQRKERSVLARTLSVSAAGLMCMVTYDVGSGFSRGLGFSWLEQYSVTISPPMSPTGYYNGWTWVICVTCAYIAYFWSTVPYVKSLTRERDSKQFLHFSVFCHFALAALALLACTLSIFNWWFFGAWLLLAARSFVLPTLVRHGLLKVQLKYIGLSEIIVSALYLVTIFV